MSGFRRSLVGLSGGGFMMLVVTIAANDAIADSGACHIGPGVSAGTSKDLRAHRAPYRFVLPKNPETGRQYQPDDIVGMGIDGDTNHTFVWFKDGYVSAGTTDDLGKFRQPYKYKLPGSYRPEDIVGMGIDDDTNRTFAWFKDGYVSAGSTDDLGKFRRPYRYKLPGSYSPEDIIGMGIDGDDNHAYAWFKDGYVSAGSTDDLGKFRKPYRVERAPAVNVGPADVIGIGIDGDSNWVFVWFVGKDSKLC